MDKRQLQYEILSAPYSRGVWQVVLKQVFGITKLFSPAKDISIAIKDPDNITKEVLELGNFYTKDERLIGVYEIILKDDAKTKLSINKVGLRNLLRSVYKYDVDGALIVFVQGKKWRFSYVSEIRTEDGKKETEPKRYTYLFGEGETCRTAAERFLKLEGKPIAIDDLYDAFSVDKLTKDFFRTYYEFYERGTLHLSSNKSYYKLLLDKTEDEQEKQEKPIRDFVKKLLGRIIFLQFLQKKGWMGCPAESKVWKDGDKQFISNLFHSYTQKDFFHSKCLRILFFETLNVDRRNKNDIAPSTLLLNKKQIRVPYLNGGLFEKDISQTNPIDFPKSYFENLFDFFEQYNFTIDENDPYDNEVGIDPEMLGHIFENLLEENRDKGAFYTPKEIVHYMCQEALIEHLFTHLPHENKDELEAFVRVKHVGLGLPGYETPQRINSILKTVKICDPAIGSGAFPMGMLKEIFECRRAIYPYLNSNKIFNPTEIKKEIIQNNIYGVDIEPGAVDIARLRFWLALVVDELVPQPLPNLDYKIIQGNSLLESFEGIDLSRVAKPDLNIIEPQRDLFGNMKENQLKFTYSQTETVNEIQSIMRDFFAYENPEDKRIAKEKINTFVHNHIRHNIFLRRQQLQRWIGELEDIGSKTAKHEKKFEEYHANLLELDRIEKRLHELQNTNHAPYFLWHLYFADILSGSVNDGFDIVIGNPPYIQLQRMGREADILQNEGYVTFSRSGDIYCLFYEQGNKLLKPNGVLCYITSNSWMKTQYGKHLRKYFALNTSPIKLLNFEDTKIFQSVVVETNILIGRKGKRELPFYAAAIRSDYRIGTSIQNYFQTNSFEVDELDENGWVISGKEAMQLKAQIEKVAIPLKNWNVNIYIGILNGYNDAFLIPNEVRNKLIKKNSKGNQIIKKILRGRDLRKYSYKWDNLWLINSHNGINRLGIERINVEKDFHEIYEHLLPYEEELELRQNKGDHWTNLRSCAYFLEFEKPKIIWGELSDAPKFAYDDTGIYAEATLFAMTGDHLKYLLAVLNSKIALWYLNQITTTSGMGTSRWKKYKIEQLPIPKIASEKLEYKFEVLVDYLIFLNDDSKPAANPYTNNSNIVSVFEDTMNMMVYELYFGKHMTDIDIDVLKFVDESHFSSLTKDDMENAIIIGESYKWLQRNDNPIRNRIILSNIKSTEIIRRINSTTH